MFIIKLLAFVLSLTATSSVYAANMWDSGELTYPSGETEISAFVNSDGNTQLQAVLCSKGGQGDYRFTLLLPKELDYDSVIKVTIKTDELVTEEYAEVAGNSLDLQIDPRLLLALPDTPKMEIVFDEEEAEYLGVPSTLEISMSGADLTLRNVASKCTALCISNNYKCNYPILSSLLWPYDNFEHISIEDIDSLCTKRIGPHLYKFNNSESCTIALDRFYKKHGIGPLSYIEKLFNGQNSSYKKYIKAWNKAVLMGPTITITPDVNADMPDWYLTLYALAGKRKLQEIPNSFYSIKESEGDPTTLVYDIDNRYEMEALKYSSVLYRRMRGSVNTLNAVDSALKYWAEFYRELSSALPNIPLAQALKPVIYRRMLMRTWRLAGRPDGIILKPENEFRQGIGGKTTTTELLESECSFFDGANGSQFYFASDDCIRGIESSIRITPLNNFYYEKVLKAWDSFASRWIGSPFYNDSIDDAVGEHPRANLGLALISLFKLYGFGDYFQLRECISSRDEDICNYESEKAYSTYKKEFEYRSDSIFKVNTDDGNTLNELNSLWLEYYHALEEYVNDLSVRGVIPKWRAEFVKGIACIEQTNALLNFPYDREELPDLSVEPDDERARVNSDNMSIEQVVDEIVKDEIDPDSRIDETIIVPE